MKIEKLGMIFGLRPPEIDLHPIQEKINELIDAFIENEKNRSEQIY